MDENSKYEFYESFRAPRHYDFDEPEDPYTDEFFNNFQDWSLRDKEQGEPNSLEKRNSFSGVGKQRNSAGSTAAHSHKLRSKPVHHATGQNPSRDLLRPSAAHNATIKSTRRYASEPPALYKGSGADENAPAGGAVATKARFVTRGVSQNWGGSSAKEGRRYGSQNDPHDIVANKAIVRKEETRTTEELGAVLLSLSGRTRVENMEEKADARSSFLHRLERTMSGPTDLKQKEPENIKHVGRTKEDHVPNPLHGHRLPINWTRSAKPRTASCPSKSLDRDGGGSSSRASSAQPARPELAMTGPASSELEERLRKLELYRGSRTARVAKMIDVEDDEVLPKGIKPGRLQRTSEHLGEALLSSRREAAMVSARPMQTSTQVPPHHPKPDAAQLDNSGKQQQGVHEKRATEEASKKTGEEKERRGRHRRSESAPVCLSYDFSLIQQAAHFPRRSTKTPAISPKHGNRSRASHVTSTSMNEFWHMKANSDDCQVEELNADDERQRKLMQYRAMRASVIKSSVPPTKPRNIVLNIDKRAIERSTFDAQLAQQRRRAEEESREKKRQQERMEAEQIRMMRKEQMIPKAQAMPLFQKVFKPQRSTKPTTRAVSPKLGRSRDYSHMFLSVEGCRAQA